MAAITLSFSKVGNVWQATTDSLGYMVMQIKRKAPGDITIEQYIDGMEPVACIGLRKKGVNELVPFSSVKGLKLKITSDSEVEKAMLMEAIYEGSSGGGPVPGNILTESDIVNDLNSDAGDKVLSAAQGKELKKQLDAKVIPTEATTAKAGLVKKMAAVEKPTDTTPEQLKICLENLIDSAKTALMME